MLNKSNELKYYLILAVTLLIALILMFGSKSGDASIYLTFIKNFFDLPFSYQPKTISYGATSPLFVILHSFFWLILEESIIYFIKIFNYILIYISLILLLKTQEKISQLSVSTIIFLVLLNANLLLYAADLYETALASFSITLLYFLIKKKKFYIACVLSPILHLVRPELSIISVFIFIYLLFVSNNKFKILTLTIIGSLPVIIYYLYMYWGTGSLIPSSVYGRYIYSIEQSTSYFEKLIAFLKDLILRPPNLFYTFSLLSILLFSLKNGIKEIKIELMFIIPLFGLFVVLPPTPDYSARYLMPITPAIISILLIATLKYHKYLKAGYFYISATFLLLFLLYNYNFFNRYDYNRILLKDLAEKLNPIVTSDDKILIYEIQGQYSLNCKCYSLDCIVGSQLADVFIFNKLELEDYIKKEHIKYIVTTNSFSYRKIFNNTILVNLYEHDLKEPIGSILEIKGLKFKKILTNPEFANSNYYKFRQYDKLNSGKYLRVYNNTLPHLTDGHFAWNSVYSVSF